MDRNYPNRLGDECKTANIYIGKVDGSGQRLTSCRSIFRLIGNDEDALTYSLGYLLAHDKQLCSDILKCNSIFKKKSDIGWDMLLKDYSIHLQEVTEQKGGRRDIVIDSPRLRVVIEAKIGGAIPSKEQIRKYIEEFIGHEKDHKVIIALVDSGSTEQISQECTDSGITFYSLRWRKIFEIVQKRSHSKRNSPEMCYLYNQFIRFLKEDYRMGFYDVEVKVQDVDEENAKIYYEGMYIGSPSEALYFAPYFTHGGGGITHVSRVIRSVKTKIDDSVFNVFDRDFDKNDSEYKEHGARWRRGLDLILKRAKRKGEKGGFYGKECTLYFLGEPIPLGRKLLKSKSFRQIPPFFSLRFDELLTLKELGSPKLDSNVPSRRK